jgi:hypothetical protein
VVHQPRPVERFLSIDSNCIVTATMTDQTGSTGEYLYVFNPNGSGARSTRLNTPDAVLSGFEISRGAPMCHFSTLGFTFAMNLNGTIVGTGPAGYVGLMPLDGKGRTLEL